MNFRRILTKSSPRSSITSGKSASNSSEVLKLQSEIDSLKQTVEALKVSLESRDAAIGTLAREKEKLYVELKSAQRTNRNLHQQLIDEREIHAKEKEFLIDEVKKSKRNDCDLGLNQDGLNYDHAYHSLQQELKAKDEVIFNICNKYLKVKERKQMFKKKLHILELRTQKICEEIVNLLQDNKRSIDILISKLIQTSDTLPDSCKKYLKLLKSNAHLNYENTELKIKLSHKHLCDDTETPEHSNPLEPCAVKDSEIKQKLSNRLQKKISHNLYRPHFSRLRKIEKSLNKFESLHEILSPRFRRRIIRFNSEPCVSCIKK